MDKKKILIISIISVLLIVAVVASSTYAYIVAISNEGNISNTGTGRLDIDYVAPKNIGGDQELKPSLNREGGLVSTATVSLADNSVKALFNMYVTPTALTNLDKTALKWEVEGIKGEQTVYSANGNFSEAEVDQEIKIVDGYSLDYENTTFNIYIWIDESLLTDSIDGAKFSAKITADSSQITGEM